MGLAAHLFDVQLTDALLQHSDVAVQAPPTAMQETDPLSTQTLFSQKPEQHSKPAVQAAAPAPESAPASAPEPEAGITVAVHEACDQKPRMLIDGSVPVPYVFSWLCR